MIGGVLFNALYIAHAGIIWAGSIREIAHVYGQKSAKDITKFWVASLIAADLIALPLALSSGYTAWWLCHIISACLVTVLLVGVKRFGKGG